MNLKIYNKLATEGSALEISFTAKNYPINSLGGVKTRHKIDLDSRSSDGDIFYYRGGQFIFHGVFNSMKFENIRDCFIRNHYLVYKLPISSVFSVLSIEDIIIYIPDTNFGDLMRRKISRVLSLI